MSESKRAISFKEAAKKILASSEGPMSPKEILEAVMQEGMIATEGRTPEATMAAQLYVDIKRKNSPFKKVGKGKFSLKQQTESATSGALLVEKQNALVRASLQQKLHEMDAYQFEFLIGDLLKKIGYENVEVTKRSGDKGIDVLADLTMEGITNVKTVVQVKRFKKGNNIAGKIVTQMRGSAAVDQRGLIITTSDFTRGAVEEARAPGKMPVALINGERLLGLLMKHEVGVKAEALALYAVDNEYFENVPEGGGREVGQGKNKAIWPLPGGTTVYVDTLFAFLETVAARPRKADELVKWFIANYENVNSEKTARSYVHVPRQMGLTGIENGKYVLTEEGKRVNDRRNIEELYEIICAHIMAFEEIVEFLRTAGSPQDEQAILDFINDNFDVQWTSFGQVNFRLMWLQNLGKVEKVEGGYAAV